MRNSVAKKLKKEVALSLDVGDGVTAADVLADMKTVTSQPEFKTMYRSRKKNYNKTVVTPRLMSNIVDNHDQLKRLNFSRLKKTFLWKKEIKRRRS